MSQHHHIFKEGPKGTLELVGDYDGYYREETDPWSQRGSDERYADYYGYSRDVLVRALQRNGAHGSGVEIGCGLGYVTRILRRRIHCPVTGLDASMVAIERAMKLHGTKKGGFLVRDITVAPHEFDPIGPFQFAVFGQCLWYVMHDLCLAMENAKLSVKPGGLIVFSQAFLDHDKQRYGRWIIDGFEGLIQFIIKEICDVRIIEARYDDSKRHASFHDGILVLRRL